MEFQEKTSTYKKLDKAFSASLSDSPKQIEKARKLRTKVDYEDLMKQLKKRKVKKIGEAVYGGAEAEKKQKLLKWKKKNLIPGKGVTGSRDYYGNRYNTDTGEMIKDTRKESAETHYYRDDEKHQKKVADDKESFRQSDARKKHGKRWKEFTKDASAAKDRLRPGEVKKFNKVTGKWESNKR